jgi:hypothetical protein
MVVFCDQEKKERKKEIEWSLEKLMLRSRRSQKLRPERVKAGQPRVAQKI